MFDKQNPNDPDDENEHFKQPHIAIEFNEHIHQLSIKYQLL